MQFPEGTPEELKELLEHAMGHQSDNKKCHTGECDHQQVVKFEGDALLTFKTFRSDCDKVRRKLQLLESEAHAVMAKGNSLRTKFWNWVYEKYGLSSNPTYHFTGDGRIFRYQNSEEE